MIKSSSSFAFWSGNYFRNRLYGDFCDRLRLCYYWLNYWLYRGYCAFGSGLYGRGDGNRRLDPDSLLF
jgi:hypothetical protein